MKAAFSSRPSSSPASTMRRANRYLDTDGAALDQIANSRFSKIVYTSASEDAPSPLAAIKELVTTAAERAIQREPAAVCQLLNVSPTHSFFAVCHPPQRIALPTQHHYHPQCRQRNCLLHVLILSQPKGYSVATGGKRISATSLASWSDSVLTVGPNSRASSIEISGSPSAIMVSALL